VDELEKLRAELKQVYANLTATQERCTELLLESRALKHTNALMKLRWLQLLEMPSWEPGPDDDTSVLNYTVSHGDYKDKRIIIERDVSPPSHRCVEDGHSYGHGDTCYYCGHEADDDPALPLTFVKLKDDDLEDDE
jgi:hypothetical protein